MKDGLVEERSCTDLPCLIVWFLFLISLVAVTWYGYANGNIDYLLAPIDGDKNMCGIDDRVKDYPLLYFTEIDASGLHSKIFDFAICVKECPDSSTATLDCADTSQVTICQMAKVRKTIRVVNYCVPDPTDTESFTPEVRENWKKSWEFATMYETKLNHISDLVYATPAMAITIGIGLVYCFIFLFALSKCTAVFLYLSIVLVQVSLIGATVCLGMMK